MKRLLDIIASALLATILVIALLLVLVWAMYEPLYGTQPAKKPVTYKSAACYRNMTRHQQHKPTHYRMQT